MSLGAAAAESVAPAADVVPPAAVADAAYTRRATLTVMVGSAVISLVGLGWTLFFALRGDWAVVGADGVLVLGSVSALLMARKRLQFATVMLLVSLLLRLVGYAAFLDLPSEQVPRAVHHFLIPLAVASHLLLKRANAWLYYGFPVLCLCAVAWFATPGSGVVTHLAVADDVRRAGTWLNNLFAMGLFYWLVHTSVSDIRPLQGLLQQLGMGGPLPDDSGAGVHIRRVALMAVACGGLLVLLGAAFAVFFTLHGMLGMAGGEAALVGLGVLLLALVKAGRVRLAAIGGATVLSGVVLALALWVDVPTAQLPRGVHCYFLALALCFYCALDQQPRWLRHGVPLACLVAFVVFASGDGSLHGTPALPEGLRPPVWLVCGLSLGLLDVLILLFAGDIDRLEATWAGRRVQAMLQRA